MAKVRDEIDKQIQNLKTELLQEEYIDLPFWEEELRELQSLVVLIHTALEVGMDFVIAKYLRKDSFSPTVIVEALATYEQYTTLDEIDFVRKIRLLKKFAILPKKKGLLEGKLREVNDIRNFFAHPNTYTREIRKYKVKQEYLNVLKTIKEAKKLMDELTRSYTPPTRYTK